MQTFQHVYKKLRFLPITNTGRPSQITLYVASICKTGNFLTFRNSVFDVTKKRIISSFGRMSCPATYATSSASGVPDIPSTTENKSPKLRTWNGFLYACLTRPDLVVSKRSVTLIQKNPGNLSRLCNSVVDVRNYFLFDFGGHGKFSRIRVYMLCLDT